MAVQLHLYYSVIWLQLAKSLNMDIYLLMDKKQNHCLKTRKSFISLICIHALPLLTQLSQVMKNKNKKNKNKQIMSVHTNNVKTRQKKSATSVATPKQELHWKGYV